MFSWIILVFAMEAGMVQDMCAIYNEEGIQSEIYLEDPESTYVKFTGEFQVLNNHLFFGGWIDNRQKMFMITNWIPYRIIYGFNAGFRFHNFEIAYDRWCDHNVAVVPHEHRPYILAGGNKMYIRYQGQF